MAEIRHTLGLPLPKKMLAVSPEARTTLQASRHASQTTRVSS